MQHTSKHKKIEMIGKTCLENPKSNHMVNVTLKEWGRFSKFSALCFLSFHAVVKFKGPLFDNYIDVIDI